MPEELKQAAQAVIDEYDKCRGDRPPAELFENLRCALTQRPAAQADEQWQETAAALNHFAKTGKWQDERPAAQATPFPFAIVVDPSIEPGQVVVKQDGQEVGRIVNIDVQQTTPDHVPGVGKMIDKQATPEPVDWKPIKTSKGGREAVRNFFRSTLKRHDFDDYITGALAADFACVLGGYLQAITTAATPEPVGEHAATVAEVHMSRYTIEWNGAPLPEGTKLFTRPAPGVPEGVVNALTLAANRIDRISLDLDHGSQARLEAIEWAKEARLAAAQAKGGE